jgi:uncharacterized protein
MAHRFESSDEIAEVIASRIVQAVSPWRIVLFGSRARGNPKDHSDYDVYVEVDDTDTSLKSLDSQIRDLFHGSGWQIDFKVKRPGTIERRRDDPGTIEWDVAREGRVLYTDPQASSMLMPPRRVREPSSNPPESMNEWLETAERDLRHRDHLWASNSDFSPEICWLSHQTCEKHMKALLISRWVRPERTHKLDELLVALRTAGCALPNLDADCKLLTKHAIEPRYPKGLDLGEDDARLASAAADRVVSAVRAELPRSIH